MKKIGLFLGIIILLSGCMSLPITPSTGTNPVDLNATQTAMLSTSQALVATQGMLGTQNALVQTQAVVNATSTAVAATLNAPATATNAPEPPTATSAPEPPTATNAPEPATVTSAPALLPVADTPTNTSIPNMLFSDDFNNGIKADWKQFGTWMVTNGQPVVVQNSQSDIVNSPFRGTGGLILPGTAQLDNFAVELDYTDDCRNYYDFYFILSFKDEKNYKSIAFVCNNNQISSFNFVRDGQNLSIPESNQRYSSKSPMNHLRLEVRTTILKLFINDKLIYNFINLPDSVAGTVGLATYSQSPIFDNFEIFQLP
jgi:archaellin